MAKITTGELYNEWQLINEKLEQLNNKVDDVIENGAINTQSVGNIVELFNEEVEVSAGAFVGVTPNFENTNFTKVFCTSIADESHEHEIRLQMREGHSNTVQYLSDDENVDVSVGRNIKFVLPKDFFTENVRIAMRNNDDKEHTYQIRLGAIV